jgi:hypothetical protein
VKGYVFKGHQSTIVQDIIILASNTQFDKEVYYSPSLRKTFIAALPKGYCGDFGPSIKALILDMHHSEKMTESAIHHFLTNHNIDIACSSISRILTDKHDDFHQEKKDILDAGLKSSVHQQTDDTGARVKGINYYTHILCNSFYTAFFTRKHKTRLTILDILMQGNMQFFFNQDAYDLMISMGLSTKMLDLLKLKNPTAIMSSLEVDGLLKTLMPNAKKQHRNRLIILEASAITAYQMRPDAIKILGTVAKNQLLLICAQNYN